MLKTYKFNQLTSNGVCVVKADFLAQNQLFAHPFKANLFLKRF